MEKYIEFTDIDEAQKWFDNNFGKFIEKIYYEKDNDGTLGEILYGYTGNMSRRYNELLMINNGDLEGLDKLNFKDEPDRNYMDSLVYGISLIYNSFCNKMPEDTILFHYCDSHAIGKIRRNSEICLNKFISASILRNFPEYRELIAGNNYNILFIIKVPKGTPCIPIGNDYGSCLREYEIILHPKTKLHISKKYYNLIKFITVVECEVV